MRDQFGMLVGMQFLGFMMKTGACPTDGDAKNMVAAAERCIKHMLEAEPRVDAMMDKAREQRYPKGGG